MPKNPTRTPASSLLSPMLNDDLLDSWELSLEARNRRPTTKANYLDTLRIFRRFLSPTGNEEDCSTRVGDITQQMCQRFVTHLLETRKQSTAKMRFRTLCTFFTWCVQDEILDESPMRKLQEPAITDKPAVLILTDDQVIALLATVRTEKTFNGYRDHALLRLLLTTGARREEIANLELADVSPKEKSVVVRRGKGGRERLAAIDPLTAQVLDHYIKRARAQHVYAHLPALWLTQHGRLTTKGINYIVERRAKQAGMEHIHPHLFRHLAAHEMLEQGMQVNNVAELLGHKDLNMIMEVYGKSLAQKRAAKDHQDHQIGGRWK